MARRVRAPLSFFVLTLIALPTLVFAIRTLRNAPLSGEDRQYNEGDYIPLFANKFYSNQEDSCEEYSYFDLPFCSPGDPILDRKRSFKEFLAGDCHVNTQYELRFKMGTAGKLLCEKNLTREEVAKFRNAIGNKYMYEMYFDSIHLSEDIGVDTKDSFCDYICSSRGFFLINHLRFYPHYLGNKVKEIHVVGDYDSALDITEDAEIKVNFTYSVFWKEFESKQENQDWVRDLSEHFGEDNPLHYTTAIIICGWLCLLCAVIVLYLRYCVTRNSFGDVMVEDTGVICHCHSHGNACRCLQYSSLFGAILGVGTNSSLCKPYLPHAC